MCVVSVFVSEFVYIFSLSVYTYVSLFVSVSVSDFSYAAGFMLGNQINNGLKITFQVVWIN